MVFSSIMPWPDLFIAIFPMSARMFFSQLAYPFPDAFSAPRTSVTLVIAGPCVRPEEKGNGGTMPTTLGALRRRLLTPPLTDVTFAERGFPVTATDATRRLEAIPQSVICGFEWAMESRDLWEIESRLNLVDQEMRGFAYEGATMAFTIRDAMRGGRGQRTRELLLGPGHDHIFLAYIGIGFAMARLPRVLWKKVLPDLGDSPYYPIMSWLAVDGYGFDRAYFDTHKWVDEQYVPEPYPWQGDADYFPRAVDHGIGRALWFINGGNAEAVVAAVRAFPDHRQADLWGGVGLAATFAGGATAAGLAALRRGAAEFQPELALGMVFAVKARTYSGFVPQHTGVASAALGDVGVAEALAIGDSTAAEGPTHAQTATVPPYELWRQRIRSHFASQTQALAS
jgi:enediyne biosynthesis protein E2